LSRSPGREGRVLPAGEGVRPHNGPGRDRIRCAGSHPRTAAMKTWLAIASVCLLCVGSATAADLAITGARVVANPDAPVLGDATGLVRDGRIAAVGPGDEVAVPEGIRVIDANGRVLVAGFWNSHVHLLAPELLATPARPAAEAETVLRAMFTRWGFTTVFDI